MSEIKGPSAGLTPYVIIRGGKAKAALAFYAEAFGAQEVYRQPAEDGVRLVHAFVRINGGALMLSDDFPEWRGAAAPAPAGFTLHLQTADPDAAWARALAAGATATQPLQDQFWGDRYGELADPFGVAWSIGGPSPS